MLQQLTVHEQTYLQSPVGSDLARECGRPHETQRLRELGHRFSNAGSILALRNLSAASSSANVQVLQSTNLRSLLQQRVEEEQALESQNLLVDVGFQEMAALKHSLKIALRVYAALQESRCFAGRRNITAEDRSNIGLG